MVSLVEFSSMLRETGPPNHRNILELLLIKDSYAKISEVIEKIHVLNSYTFAICK